VGTQYAGFQSQPGKKVVQTTLERAISATTQEDIRVVGAGRTDAGAHAYSQVVTFSTDSILPVTVLVRAINAHLPRDIVVARATEIDPSFHPRHDATSRLYRYLIWNRPVRSPFWEARAAHVRPRLQVETMDEAAKCLLGLHDFSAFAPVNAIIERTRVMYAASCRRDGDLVTLDFEAQGFMRQMARALAGTLLGVGLGKITLEEFEHILQSGDRTQAGETMPAYGLYLVRVKYPATKSISEGVVSVGSPHAGNEEQE
jgi:tRNA pseudouridine38-40 synthase